MGRTVLVVDPSDELRERTRKLLEAHGYDVLEASDGIGAWGMVCRHRPGLITVRRPNEVYGVRALFDSIRANVEMEGIPVVVVDPGPNYAEDLQERHTVLCQLDIFEAPENFVRVVDELLRSTNSHDPGPSAGVSAR